MAAKSSTSGDRGSISAFVVCLAMTFFFVAGLAVDSGRILASKIAVADHAENAARIGAQQVGGLRTGEWSIDAESARRAALRYLADFGLGGEVLVDSSSVVVSTSLVENMTLLRLVGVSSSVVRATRRAELVDG